MAIFGQKLWAIPLRKMTIFPRFELVFGHFWAKTKGTPFRKMTIFLLFQLRVFYTLERRFFVPDYHKRLFPGLYFLKKKVGKMAIF